MIVIVRFTGRLMSDSFINLNLRMSRLASLDYYRIETAFTFDGILYDSNGAVGLFKAVLAFYHIPISLFRMVLVIAVLVILHLVLELVFSRCLYMNKITLDVNGIHFIHFYCINQIRTTRMKDNFW